MSYEYLKPLFEGGPLSFEQLTEKLDAADGVKLVNLQDGGYVSKDKFDALEVKAGGLQAQLTEANDTQSGRPRPSRCSRRPTRRWRLSGLTTPSRRR